MKNIEEILRNIICAESTINILSRLLQREPNSRLSIKEMSLLPINIQEDEKIGNLRIEKLAGDLQQITKSESKVHLLVQMARKEPTARLILDKNNLLYLDLSNNKLGRFRIERLASSITWAGIEHLNLLKNNMGDLGAEKLAANTTWTNIQHLDLQSNIIGDLGTEKISANTLWTNLQHLDLLNNRIGDLGAEKLAANP